MNDIIFKDLLICELVMILNEEQLKSIKEQMKQFDGIDSISYFDYDFILDEYNRKYMDMFADSWSDDKALTLEEYMYGVKSMLSDQE